LDQTFAVTQVPLFLTSFLQQILTQFLGKNSYEDRIPSLSTLSAENREYSSNF